MSKETMYRCTNRSGPDGACEYAENEELIPSSKIKIDDAGNPLCPGKTVFGDPCGAVLVDHSPPPPPPWRWLILAAGVAVIVIIGLMIPRGEAILRIEPTSVSLAPGESAKIELFNDGDGTLKIKKTEFSSDAFSFESAEEISKVEPGGKGGLRIQLGPDVNNNVEGTLTLYTNSSETPVTIDLSANVDPWSVFKRLSLNSKILKQE